MATFSAGGHKIILYQRRILGRGGSLGGLVGRSPPEAEVFSLNYTLIFDFLSMK